MKTEIHACFESKESVIHAVESLLRHGVREQDITLIIPHPPPEQEPGDLASTQILSEVVAAPKHDGSAVVVGGEEGVGVGFGLGLLTAMCVPGIGMIAGSGNIVATLTAAGAVIGGIAGGVYGYLVERDIPHAAAEAMADHILSGGATLSVSANDPHTEETIVQIVEGAGGRIVLSDDSDAV